jgi:ribonuclease HI
MWNRISAMMDTDHSGSVVLQGVIQRGDHVQGLDIGLAELILTRGWYLWWERRKITHDENVSRPSRSGLMIVSLTKNFKMAEGKGLRIRQGWRKPPDGYIIIIIDASYDENEGCGSTGVVIRDSTGRMIAATNSYIPHLTDAQMAEAYAFKEGLMLAQHIGGNRLIIQSDCMEIVEVMKKGASQQTQLLQYMMNASLFGGGFQEISIEHLNREANQVAHELARQAMIMKTNCIWDDDPPSFIVQLLANDVTILDQ